MEICAGAAVLMVFLIDYFDVKRHRQTGSLSSARLEECLEICQWVDLPFPEYPLTLVPKKIPPCRGQSM